MENNLFPKPEQILTFPAPLCRAINDVRQRIFNKDLEFKPSYETNRYFQEIKALLKDDGWALNKKENGEWLIEVFRG